MTDSPVADKFRRSFAKLVEEVVDIAKTVAWAVAIALVARTLVIEPFNIPSGSMMPTLLEGDYLFVSKWTYGYSRHSFPFSFPPFPGRYPESLPERGDVIVFKYPGPNPAYKGENYIKRIVGLPGDKVKVKEGILYVNGQPATRKNVGPLHYTETMPVSGRRHDILETSGDTGSFDNTDEYTVPARHVFVMGDNRDNSMDSRSEGVWYVPFDNIVGRAEFIFYSHDGTVSLGNPFTWPGGIRYSRLFSGIR